ncbi:hypothetical protein [Paenibacillus hexagrammi]|uniref:Uncharacterized protein n=1 Tax=Paenibacillus hexagrammi TaxID=2908839 RepID=A0ABY3SB53_9BACL|nr:hypothetical protein [Paenibacillus sp. YPD9-1]UJF31218.1 hypothetical protein L0M14_15160 [Paenibacillus sp. YPD9-1]
MIIDYWEKDDSGSEPNIYVGLQFEDEPDSLYVAELILAEDRSIHKWGLLFNGFDCNYAFREEEKDQITTYLKSQGLELL